jgi:hypothetical protein
MSHLAVIALAVAGFAAVAAFLELFDRLTRTDESPPQAAPKGHPS